MTGHAGEPATARRDGGSAVVEFVTLGMLLLLPVVYLVVTLGRVQAATFAVDGAAREAARVLVTAPDEAAGRRQAAAAVRLGLTDQGLRERAALTLACPPAGCLVPGGADAATVTLVIGLPGLPGFLRGALPTALTVRSRQVAVVDPFRATG